jgi:aryl-alcohol dehydrogenase
MRVKAAIAYRAREPFVIAELDLDEPHDDEILVRIQAAGVSHLDLRARDGELLTPLPAVLGREAAGWVERVGARVTKVAPGDHVVLTFLPGKAGTANIRGSWPFGPDIFDRNFFGFRPNGSSPLNGGGERIAGAFFGQSSFATYALAREENAVRVPREIPWPVLAALGGNVQTGAGTVIGTLHPRPGDSIAVFGVGAAGLAAILAARLAGCHPIIAVDTRASRLELAEAFGATTTIDPDGLEPVEAIRGLTGSGTHFSVETTAAPAAVRQAVDSLAPGGTCALTAMGAPNASVLIGMTPLLLGRAVRGSLFGGCLPATLIPRLVEFWRQGRFPIDSIIREYPLEEINRAAEDLVTGAAVKPVLIMP